MRVSITAFSIIMGMMLLLLTSDAFSMGTPCNAGIEKDSIPSLSEIIIEGKKKKMLVRHDTTVFRVSAFRDGSEKKIEELIAKLPGMSVNPDNGMISYQGRTVEAVKIDGFDLLGSNYALGTRNISVDIIDEIEAVENDPENPLLKSIQQNGKLILNLKTKNKSASSNGNISGSTGKRGDPITPVDAQLNLLRMAPRMKSFHLASYNNRGVNNGSFNYFQSTQQNELAENPLPLTESFFHSLLPVLPIESLRYHINNMGMANGNFLLQSGKKQESLRLNLFLMQDRLIHGYEQVSNINSAFGGPSTSDKFSSIGKIMAVEAEIEWRRMLSKKMWLQYRGNIQNNKTHSLFTQLLNDSLMTEGGYVSRKIYHLHELDFTFRASKRAVMRSKFNISHQDREEVFENKPISSSPFSEEQKMQHLLTTTKALHFTNSIMLNRGNKSYDFQSGLQYVFSPFSSWQQYENSLRQNDSLSNWQRQGHSNMYHSAGFTIMQKNISFSGKAAIHFHAFSWLNIQGARQWRNTSVPELSLGVTQKLSQELKWVHKIGVNNELLSRQPYMHQPIFTSPRVILLNEITPSLQRHFYFNSLLVYQNLFKQQFAQVGFQYTLTDKSVITGLEIDARSMLTRTWVEAVPQKRWQLNGRYEVFVRQLNTSFTIHADAGVNNYYNQVNTKLLRNLLAHSFSGGIQCKTSFSFPSISFTGCR